LAGRNSANPMGAILSVGMMLDDVGWQMEAKAVEGTVRSAVREGRTTNDLGGKMTTETVGDWISEQIAKKGISEAAALI
jgi:3-isopropylmalate dehydrogenase